MNAERHSLAEAFKPTSSETSVRGSSLQGLLKPKDGNKKRSLAPIAAAPSEEVPLDTRSQPVKRPSISNQPGAKKSASKTVAGPARNVAVYLPPATLDAVKAKAREEQTTYSDLLVDAFDAVDPEDIARTFNVDAEAAPASVMPRRVRRPRGTAGIQIQLRLDEHQVEWLDAQVSRYQASSRSALVSTVLQLHTA
jgi:hypothetical protein